MYPRLPYVVMMVLSSSAGMRSQELPPGGPPTSLTLSEISANPDLESDNNEPEWVRAWMRIAAKARASQPHFVAPLVTNHVMLVQQFRYDISRQQDPSGATTTSNYGNSRGLEFIPSSRLEVGLFPPGYVVHQTNVASGFSDLSYQVKFRAWSAPEGKGDYFVGFFFGGTVPTGSAPNGLDHAVLSPTFAVAKGLGLWDIQSTIGATIPASGTDILGRAILFNTEVDYKIKGKVWPLLEQNSTFWVDGPLTGKQQVFVTPGVVVGPFPLNGKLHFGLGCGMQIAVTQFHQYNHRWIFSLRFPF
jgi:hypothetical protein